MRVLRILAFAAVVATATGPAVAAVTGDRAEIVLVRGGGGGGFHGGGFHGGGFHGGGFCTVVVFTVVVIAAAITMADYGVLPRLHLWLRVPLSGVSVLHLSLHVSLLTSLRREFGLDPNRQAAPCHDRASTQPNEDWLGHS